MDVSIMKRGELLGIWIEHDGWEIKVDAVFYSFPADPRTGYPADLEITEVYDEEGTNILLDLDDETIREIEDSVKENKKPRALGHF